MGDGVRLGWQVAVCCSPGAIRYILRENGDDPTSVRPSVRCITLHNNPDTESKFLEIHAAQDPSNYPSLFIWIRPRPRRWSESPTSGADLKRTYRRLGRTNGLPAAPVSFHRDRPHLTTNAVAKGQEYIFFLVKIESRSLLPLLLLGAHDFFLPSRCEGLKGVLVGASERTRNRTITGVQDVLWRHCALACRRVSISAGGMLGCIRDVTVLHFQTGVANAAGGPWHTCSVLAPGCLFNVCRYPWEKNSK